MSVMALVWFSAAVTVAKEVNTGAASSTSLIVILTLCVALLPTLSLAVAVKL